MPLFVAYIDIQVRLKLVKCMKYTMLVGLIFLAVFRYQKFPKLMFGCEKIELKLITFVAMCNKENHL